MLSVDMMKLFIFNNKNIKLNIRKSLNIFWVISLTKRSLLQTFYHEYTECSSIIILFSNI
jgi:hypothetical protein